METGQEVQRGSLMVRIDPRTPKNQVDQAQADLDVARATLANAESQKRRSEELYQSQSITEQEYEQSQLDYANAKASVIRAQVALDNANIRLEDTDVRAPISGTVIEKLVERGQVISSPTSDVGGGTVILRMADLNLVQVRTLVDETDIGKIQPGLQATVAVDAYPNRPFEGEVLKIEPLATTTQNVTMFPVIVRIRNREGLLRPGMNAEVEIHVGRRDSVLAIPNAALRTTRDVASAASVLGLDPEAVNRQLAASQQDTTRKDSLGARPAGAQPDSAPKHGCRGDVHAAHGPAGAAAGGSDGEAGPGRPGQADVGRAAHAGGERPAADGVRRHEPGWRAGGGPARVERRPVRRPLHRLRPAERPAHPGLRADRPHRPGLQRGEVGADRERLGPGAARAPAWCRPSRTSSSGSTG